MIVEGDRSEGGKSWTATRFEMDDSSRRIESAEAIEQTADLDLQLRRRRPRQRGADFLVELDEPLGRGERRLAAMKAGARVAQELIEQAQLALQIRVADLGHNILPLHRNGVPALLLDDVRRRSANGKLSRGPALRSADAGSSARSRVGGRE